jgi:hypothetical protein
MRLGLTFFKSDIELTTPSRVSEVHSQNLFAEMIRLLDGPVRADQRESQPPDQHGSVVMHQLSRDVSQAQSGGFIHGHAGGF